MSNDFVQVSITIDSIGLTRQGYGKPLIVSHNATFPDKSRSYASPSDVLEDFASDSPEYLSASGFFAQSPKPPEIAIGRVSLAVPTLAYELAAGAPVNSYAYTVEVKGEGVTATTASYTSGSSATVEQIHDGLKTALNAVVGKNYTAAFKALVYADKTFTAANASEIFTAAAHGLKTGDGPFQVSNSGGALPSGLVALTNYYVIRIDANTFYLATSLANALAGTHLSIADDGTGTHTISDTVSTVRPSDPLAITANAAGDWFSLKLSLTDVKRSRLTIHTTHAAPAGLAEELDDLLDDDDSWYQLHILYPSSDYITEVADWAEQNERTFVFSSSDTDIVNVAVGSGTDIGALALAENYSATAGFYYDDPSKFAAARWMGRWLPTDPGQATAALKTLVGLPTLKLTQTQKNNLKNRRMQSYIPQYGIGVTSEGMVFSTTYRFLDTRRDTDWLTDEVRKSVFEAMAGSDKIPFTPPGVAKLEGKVRGSVSLAVSKGVLAEGTTDVTAPDVNDATQVTSTDKSTRTLRNLAFSGTFQGAVHYAIPVKGTITF